jgi:hypothetical protein
MSEKLKPIIDEIKSTKKDPNIELIKTREQFKYGVIVKIISGVSWCWTVWNLPIIIESSISLIIQLIKLFSAN